MYIIIHKEVVSV